MRVVILISAAMLVAAIVLVVRRAEAGPSILDRVVALDVTVSTMLAAFALYAAWFDRRDLLPVMVVLSLVGFVGSVSVARFASAESEDERRILTAEEIARMGGRRGPSVERSAVTPGDGGPGGGAPLGVIRGGVIRGGAVRGGAAPPAGGTDPAGPAPAQDDDGARGGGSAR
ncbi:MAG TPA: monovalent cation/H+ antiporter complex subunit F [Actinotalea sp.]|nr:monovalent cation/H+ antiporter complex subunit F [Actinotalea sp.]